MQLHVAVLCHLCDILLRHGHCQPLDRRPTADTEAGRCVLPAAAINIESTSEQAFCVQLRNEAPELPFVSVVSDFLDNHDLFLAL